MGVGVGLVSGRGICGNADGRGWWALVVIRDRGNGAGGLTFTG